TSERVSTSSPLISACSGDMYSGVPIICAKWVNRVLSVSCWPVALAMPKSITLGTATPSCRVTSTLAGLRSRWMTPLVCACCTARHTDTNSPSRADSQAVVVAELGDGHAAHQLHDEVGPSRGGFAAVEDLGDVGVVHEGQG